MIQIATNADQSARLIACGVDPKSADMSYIVFQNGQVQYLVGNVVIQTGRIVIDGTTVSENENLIGQPAWSLSALLYALKGVRILVAYQPDTKEWQALSGRPAVVYGAYSDNPIESCVKLIERLTSEGYKLNEI